MSGGHFCYQDRNLKNEIFGYRYEKPVPNIFEDKEISELVWDVLDLVHDFDWYISGDTSEDDWLEAKGLFKAKWLRSDGQERCKNIVDGAVEELREELYKTFGLGPDGDLIK